MRYFRCKCGNNVAWSSGFDPSKCDRCSTCGTNCYKEEPRPHDFSSYSTERGIDGPVKVPICSYCYRTKWEIENDESRNTKI